MARELNDFVLSACNINAEYASIIIRGADLNTKIINRLLQQIYDRLLQITSKQKNSNNNKFANKNNNIDNQNENKNNQDTLSMFDISNHINKINQT